MDILLGVLVLAGAGLSFTVSASAGLGGSLVLVPTLALILGTKEGIALAALLLGLNNVVKVFAYRESLPFRKAGGIVVGIMIGAFVGSRLLVAVAHQVVAIAVLVSFSVSLLLERFDGTEKLERIGAPTLSVASGATSGFSGTSGPLKGVAVRSLGLGRQHTVGAASLASLAGDLTKTAIFAEASLLGQQSLVFAAASLPLMVVATFGGRRLNRRLGETGYTTLFWTVMGGYSIRIIAGL